MHNDADRHPPDGRQVTPSPSQDQTNAIQEEQPMRNSETNLTTAETARRFPARRYDRAFSGNELDSRILEGEEVREKRTAHQKVYSLGNGAYQCILFPEAVHYQDASGVWQDIDNTLAVETRQGKARRTTRGAGLTMSLAVAADDDELVRLTNANGQSIAWKLEGARAKQAVEEATETQRFYQRQDARLARRSELLEALEKEHPDTETLENAHARAEENQGSLESPGQMSDALDALDAEIDFDLQRHRPRNLEASLRYDEILPNVDMVCHLNGQRFKDDLILKNADAPSSFDLRLFSSPGLAWRCLSDGTVLAVSEATGDEVAEAGMEPDPSQASVAFVLPPAFAVDSDGARGIVYTVLEECADGAYLNLRVDAAWLDQATFPVIVDPVVTPGYKPATIVGNNVSSAAPNTVMKENFYKIRKSSPSNNYRAFIKLPELPVNPDAYALTKATVTLPQSTTSGSGFPTLLRRPLQDWDPTTITWNNQPDLDEIIYDAVLPQSYDPEVDISPIAKWNITRLLKRWYEEENFGLCLDTDCTYLIEYLKSSLFTIHYTAKAGLSDNIPHESMGAGSAGTGHVNLFNGNFVFSRGITACNGQRMPVSLSATYNSCPLDHGALSVPMGPGWQMSSDVYLHIRTIRAAQNAYTLVSGDGSVVDFADIRNTPLGLEYADLSGKGLTLTEVRPASTGNPPAEIRIAEKGGTTFHFKPVESPEAPERLQKITDAHGNTIHFVYGKGLLTHMSDGVGRKTLLCYQDGRLDHIVAPGEKQAIQFLYDAQGRLIRIVDVDGTAADYVYTDGRLTRAAGSEGLSLDVTYASAAPHHAVFLAQSGLDSQGEVLGNRRSYTYESGRTRSTDETVPGGKSIYHTFNEFGNRIVLQDELGFAQATYYSPDGLPNHPATVSKPLKTVTPLEVPHTRFDSQPTYAVQLEEGATGSYSYDTATQFMGNRSLKLAKTNALGRISIPYASVRLEAGKSYTLSAYTITSGAACALASARIPNGQGQIVQVDGDALPTTLDWMRLTVSFHLPVGVAEADGKAPVQLLFSATEGVGNVFLDCVQLESGESAGSYNILYNGDFHNADPATGMPVGWTYYRNPGTPPDPLSDGCLELDEDGKPEGLGPNVMRIYGRRNQFKSITQVIPIRGKAGDAFVFGGWARGMALPDQGARSFHISITISSSPKYSIWNDTWSHWQFASGVAKAHTDYTQVTIKVEYSKNENHVDLDGIFLFRERFGTAYAFDDQGNVLSMTNLMTRSLDATYDSKNNLIKYRTQGKTGYTTLEYATPSNHLVTKSTSPQGRTRDMQYDTYGNLTQERIFHTEEYQGSTRTYFVASKSEYTGDGNYLQSQSNALGKKTYQATDTCRGTLMSAQDASGQVIHYDYDEKKRLTEAFSEAEGKAYRNAYAYENGRLTEISHNTTTDHPDVTYAFQYDALGNPTETKVGTRLLSRNVYSQKPDKILERLEYGNGAQVHYGYDEYKRLITVRYDGMQNPAIRYHYDQHGKVSKLVDSILHRIEEDQYDGADRLVLHRELEQLPGAASPTPLVRFFLEYDDCNRIKKVSETIQGVAYPTEYAYNQDDLVTKVTYHNSARYNTYTYDQFNRLTRCYRGTHPSTTYSYNEGGYFNVNVFGAPNYSHSTQIQKITDAGKTWEYTYDDNGNILSEKRNNQEAQTLTYVYDALGQLIRANDPTENKTWTYAYDQGGNLLARKTYAHTTGSLDGKTPQSTDTYAYTDNNWKDKLTAYNGKAITYDAIGNPLSDGTWTYAWTHGRLLKSMTKSGQTIQYTYNYSGLRVKKTVNGVETHYTLCGKQIVYLRKGTTQMHFYYDGQDKPGLVTYNGSDYYYAYNLQGDVVGLIDPSNQWVVEYRYDPWGQPLACTGSLASTLGVDNPFRYRGYVFDVETGIYYLRARYYEPNRCKFIHADTNIGNISDIFSHNSFCYCKNNPILLFDQNGKDYAITYERDKNGNYVEYTINSMVFYKVIVDIFTDDVITFNHVFYIRKDDDAVLYSNIENNTYEVTRGYQCMDIAYAILDAFREIKGYDLERRTFLGIFAEIVEHDRRYQRGDQPRRTQDANIGIPRIRWLSNVGLYPAGNDNDAWIWEGFGHAIARPLTHYIPKRIYMPDFTTN